ncbi:MAG: DNA-binding protein [Clostridia bacterium]|nr:DNA-binding protein [Clostridia bacterium]
MLTEKQREVAELYYEEDYSLAEIAQQENVSRQSVHDTLHRVEKQLRTLEEKLGMRRRLNGVEEALTQAKDFLPKASNTEKTRIYLEKALRLLNDEEETNGL